MLTFCGEWKLCNSIYNWHSRTRNSEGKFNKVMWILTGAGEHCQMLCTCASIIIEASLTAVPFVILLWHTTDKITLLAVLTTLGGCSKKCLELLNHNATLLRVRWWMWVPKIKHHSFPCQCYYSHLKPATVFKVNQNECTHAVGIIFKQLCRLLYFQYENKK